MTYPHVPSGFINTIAESGTKEEAIQHLQELWNEVVVLRAAVEGALNHLKDAVRKAGCAAPPR